MYSLNIDAKVREDYSVDLYFLTWHAREFRILREKTDGFGFMFYDGDRKPANAEVLFEGAPEMEADYYHFCDKNTEVNTLYFYWVELLHGDSEPVLSHPIMVTVRDNRTWWRRKQIDEYVMQLKNDFPDLITISECGKTTAGYPVKYLTIGNPDRRIAFVGTVHAAESGPENILPAIRNILEIDSHFFDKTGIAMLPSIGSDTREKSCEGTSWYLRATPNGTDVNRNFPAHWEDVSKLYGLSTDFYLDNVYRGPFPASENETQAVMRYVDEVKPEVLFSCHWIAPLCENKFVYSAYAAPESDYAKKCNEYAVVYSKGFEKLLKRKFTEDNFFTENLSTGGSLPTYCYEKGIIAFDLEGGINDEFIGVQQGSGTYEMLQLNVKCHENAIRSIIAYLNEKTAE